jgi:hypothetical protein
MRITEPAPSSVFTIAADPRWPKIEFRTDATGPHRWEWRISWRNFERSGTTATSDGRWNAEDAIRNCGGTLTVRVSAGNAVASTSVQIAGTNPSAILVGQYLATRLNSAGMEAIIHHESKCKQFTVKGEPLRSFDNGFGLCQLTNPAPTIEQLWNWQLHVDMGLSVLEQKRNAAVLFLSRNKRTYTDTQLKYETVSRWNGGSYHEWDDSVGWVRRTDVICDVATGNIGWNTNKPENQGKTEAELRARDGGNYGAPRAGGNWGFFGVCYADHLLG